MKKKKFKLPPLPKLTKPLLRDLPSKVGRPRKRPIPDHPDAKAMKRRGKYEPTRHPVETYILVSQGRSLRQVAQAFGVSEEMLTEHWCRKPEMAYAIERAKFAHDSVNAKGEFLNYALDHLPEHLRPVWDRMRLLAPCNQPRRKRGQPPPSAPSLEEVQKFTSDLTVRERQSLFVHAYCSDEGSFIPAVACRLTGIPRDTVDRWMREDDEFKKLLAHLVQAKKDFYEFALVNQVRRGDPFAITFVNKTLNRDRGYGEKVDVNVNATVTQQEGTPIQSILSRLSPGALEEVLAAIRAVDAERPSPALKQAERVVDV